MVTERESSADWFGRVFLLLVLTFVSWKPLQGIGGDLLLRIGGVHADGEITAVEEEIQDGDEGQSKWFHSATYTFRTSEGKDIAGVIRGEGRLRADLQDFDSTVPVVVEYLSRYPSINAPRMSRDVQGWGGLISRTVLAAGLSAWWGIVVVKLLRPVSRRPAAPPR